MDSPIVRAHQGSAGLAVAGETLVALEQALTEEKAAPLPERPPVLRVMRPRPHPRPARHGRTSALPPGDGARRRRRPPRSADSGAG
ncbi:hypothetical protein ACWCOT_42085 [Nonomuraea bangladeshensis]|uniref:hypothetical protein n=1 Tax=Nonomuraea bangladeshensis TaxID=404385 RepID=UPI003C2DB326